MKGKLVPIFILLLLISLVSSAQTIFLLGMTTQGGHHGTGLGGGTIFSCNSVSGVDTLLHSFGNDSDGAHPFGSLIMASDSQLYGLTSAGGVNDSGTIFSYNMGSGVETVLHNFNGADGKSPLASLFQAADGLLYGVTEQGGASDSGVLFSYNINTATYTKLHDFGGNGTYPQGKLMQASDSRLYGTTSKGGAYNYGTIFNYDITGNTYTDAYNFSADTDLAYPKGALIEPTTGLLYGLAASGGAHYDGGGIFLYNISTGLDTVLYFFNGSDSDGESPYGSLLKATNGLLYGTAFFNGGNDLGAIFSYNATAGLETVLHAFTFTNNDGGSPKGSFIQAADGLLYATTTTGGAHDVGTIFSYDPVTATYTHVHDFSDLTTDGISPYGDLLTINITDTTVVPPTSINALSANYKLQISPNPSSGQFMVQLPGNQNNCPTEIYNVLGEKIAETVLSNTQNTINLSNQPSGMYFVYINTGTTVVTGKIMIAK